MIKIFFLLLTVIFLLGCEDCSKPTKQVCAKYGTTIVPVYNPGSMTVHPTIVSVCKEYKEIPNECYKGEN